MLRLTKLSWLLVAIILCGLEACGGGTPINDPSVALTEIWHTVEVAQTQTALAVSPTPSFTITPAVSPTMQATSTLLPGVASATPLKTSTSVGTLPPACDNYLFIDDVTYPDGSEVVASAPFDKTWRIQNSGPCSWNQNYMLIFGWGGAGTNWNTAPGSKFGANVLPGEMLEITVTLTAPATAGTYQGAFRLQNDKGVNFGAELTVVVIVK
jgi:hypothetical protein